ncbi:MAG: Gfo/Idh/MocA family oxidoreductase [Planctomycetota bacterium]
MRDDIDAPASQRNQDRRLFLQAVAALAGTACTSRLSQADATTASPSEKLALGIMGVNGRGSAIAKGMLATGQTEIAYVCDVDSRAADRAVKRIAESQDKPVKIVTDFRRILDDGSVDALVCAAPNHWHAPATIAGCKAGKHVYVEKPCSHTPWEGEMAIQAARKHQRVVQMGTQRRSWPAIRKAIEKTHSGEIGNALYARCWYNNRRSSIGVGQQVSPPAWLNWELWQGPCTRRPYKSNLVHYNWHWHWHWGNGELGNNGVHGIDVARWALGVTYPIRVTAGGGKYRHEDDQETPDTLNVTFDFPENKTITWEGLSWSPLGPHDSRFGLSIHGSEGSMVITGANFIRYDNNSKEVEREESVGGDSDHFLDFIDAVRSSRRPHADIEAAHQSTLLCHLGNLAYRNARVLETDPSNGHILNNETASAMWSKDYADGREPTI